MASSGNRSNHSVLFDVAIGLFAGLVATQVTNFAQVPLKQVTPNSVGLRERLVRPGPSSSQVAARKAAETMGVCLTRSQASAWGKAIHFAIGIGWGPVYILLRRYTGVQPAGAALASGIGMSLILDEGLVPVLGLSAPNHRYSMFTRIRGVLAHLVYGAAVALATEASDRLVVRLPGFAPDS